MSELPLWMKQLSSLLAIVLTFIAFIPYFNAIMAGKIRPHIFTWGFWGITLLIIGSAQLAGGAGLGAWPVLTSGLLSFVVVWLAMSGGQSFSMTKTDWNCFWIALPALPFWLVTGMPLIAVTVLSLINLYGFTPIFRRSWDQPYGASMGFFGLAVLRNMLLLIALERYSLTTMLFPTALLAACLALCGMLYYRRGLLKMDTSFADPPDTPII